MLSERRAQNCQIQLSSLSVLKYCSTVVAPSGDFEVYSSLTLNSGPGPAGCADIAGAAQASNRPTDNAKEIVFEIVLEIVLEIVFMGHRSVAHPRQSAISRSSP